MSSCKEAHVPKDLMRMGLRWYVAYPLRSRHGEARLAERGVPVDHAPIQPWGVKDSPHPKGLVWVRWRMDKTYSKVKGQWRYLDRAVDPMGQTMDLLRPEERDEQAAKRFLPKAMRRHGVPDKRTMDGRAANEAAIKSSHAEHGTTVAIRKSKYWHKMVAQAHRGVKRVTRPMLGGKAFDAAQGPRAGVELMPMSKKKQMVLAAGEEGLRAAEQFYALAV